MALKKHIKENRFTPRKGRCESGVMKQVRRCEWQPQERRAGTAGQRHPVQPELSGFRRPLPFRATSGGGGARQLEGTRRPLDLIYPRQLLCRPCLHGRGRPQCPGQSLD